ncbi:MCE family protein [Phycicoccus duodecadis]|uniref:Phospholipid/cholesterol/gamma-HCH transport system substrate-binding protein n=1 Tax=Phycicoccus duodecadis TaxID=173053 RepID=A0A2N3YHJ1_9MICO|nr:MCE family protein [Phycicoccus duodecadis]PKW26304.1 phospholipid/cholesterol/gamma-HCH transport system substrate-binding protein [Phycicoccus duodecadis]
MISRPSLRRPRRPARPAWLAPLGARLRSVPPRLGLVAGILVVALVAAAVVFWPRPEPVRVTADFVRAVGLFPGSDVRILGVRVGTVTSVEPEGDKVRVAFEFTPEHPVPADARAAVVAPSLVSDRYVQLLPAYTAGPRMRSGAHIPLDRTAVPVELDRVSQSLDDLMVALGPKGANSEGALTRVLRTGAANLDGNGQALHDTTQNLSLAVQTFSQGRGDLFGTVKNLNTFTETLATNDTKVRRLNTNLASVSTALDDERGDLSAALANLAVALDEISGFVKDNRAVLKDDVGRLADVTGAVAAKRKALGETLDNAPAAISNLQLAYDAANGTLDTRATVQGADDPGLLLCSLVTGPTNTGNTTLCDSLGLLDLKVPTGSSAGSLLKGADPTLGGLLG